MYARRNRVIDVVDFYYYDFVHFFHKTNARDYIIFPDIAYKTTRSSALLLSW